MNIQIYGTSKDFDTKKAERYFKERNIKYQFIDLTKFGMSRGELNSIKQAVGSLDKLINYNSKDKDLLALFKYLSAEDQEVKLLENQKLFVTPLVRNGKKATIGYQPELWKNWE